MTYLQEVLAQAFRDIKQFQQRDDSSFVAWLKTIADHRLPMPSSISAARSGAATSTDLHRRISPRTSTAATLIDIVCHDSHVPQDSAERREMETGNAGGLRRAPGESA